MISLKVPTLLVNRQLHSETLAALKLLPTKHSYVLDIMFVNEHCLCLTWLLVPEVTTRVDRVYATLRTVTTGENGRAFMGGDGSPPRIVWHFYALLEFFLKVGPVGPQKERIDDGDFSIKTLDLCREQYE
jgi:hypothetical protein